MTLEEAIENLRVTNAEFEKASKRKDEADHERAMASVHYGNVFQRIVAAQAALCEAAIAPIDQKEAP